MHFASFIHCHGLEAAVGVLCVPQTLPCAVRTGTPSDTKEHLALLCTRLLADLHQQQIPALTGLNQAELDALLYQKLYAWASVQVCSEGCLTH